MKNLIFKIFIVNYAKLINLIFYKNISNKKKITNYKYTLY